LAAEVNGHGGSAVPAGVDAKWISECAKDLLANKGESLVVAGHRQPFAVHLLAQAINAALGNVGKTVILHEVADLGEGDIADFAKVASELETVVIIGANPVYNAPVDVDVRKPWLLLKLSFASAITKTRLSAKQKPTPTPGICRCALFGIVG